MKLEDMPLVTRRDDTRLDSLTEDKLAAESAQAAQDKATPGPKVATSTTSTLTRAQMVAAIKLRDPSFVDSVAAYSDDYISGRYAQSISSQPLVGVPKEATAAPGATKTDAADELHPVTRAQIERDKASDIVRGITPSPVTTKRTDASADLHPVTQALLDAHNRTYPNGAA